MKFFGTYTNDYFVANRVAQLGPGNGRMFVDVPAGEGRMSAILSRQGFDVRPLDLFPEAFKAPNITCAKADLELGLPLPDATADFLLCEEGIEHIPDTLALLKEFNRVLKDGGNLLITTPNISCLRCKASYYALESDFYRRLPPTEMDSVWFSKEDGRVYYGHIFLINVQKLLILAKLAGFELVKIHPMKISWTSLLLGISWPVIWLANYSAYLREVRKRKKFGPSTVRKIFGETMRINTSPTVLFSKHLFIEFRKSGAPYEAIRSFHQKLLHEPDVVFDPK